jgi:hypothetical protein
MYSEFATDAMLRNPDNGKDTVQSNPPESSFGATASFDQFANMIQASRASRIAELQAHDGSMPDFRVDLVDRSHIADSKPLFKPAILAAAYHEGDKIYHKKHKEEAYVRKIGSDGRIQVKWRNGEKSWVKPDNIVKL